MKLKDLKTNFLYIILPVGLMLILVIVLYQSSQRIKVLKSGIDLKPRPFSELLATDFADVKDEVADPSKCDGTKVIEQIKKSSTNPNLASKWKDYDPNIHKLTILDDCWRQYENEYVKFKFRDLNGSLKMWQQNVFGVTDSTFSKTFWVNDNRKGNKKYINAVLSILQSNQKLISMSQYKSPNGEIILRTEVLFNDAVPIKVSLYTIDLPGTDRYIYIDGYSSGRIIKDILSTIEIKK